MEQNTTLETPAEYSQDTSNERPAPTAPERLQDRLKRYGEAAAAMVRVALTGQYE